MLPPAGNSGQPPVVARWKDCRRVKASLRLLHLSLALSPVVEQRDYGSLTSAPFTGVQNLKHGSGKGVTLWANNTLHYALQAHRVDSMTQSMYVSDKIGQESRCKQISGSRKAV